MSICLKTQLINQSLGQDSLVGYCLQCNRVLRRYIVFLSKTQRKGIAGKVVEEGKRSHSDVNSNVEGRDTTQIREGVQLSLN